MKYIILFFLLSGQTMAGDLRNILLSIIQQKLQPKTTTYYGNGQMLDTRYYLGDQYINAMTEQPTQVKQLTREKVDKLLNLYPHATVVIQRKQGERLPPSIILLLER